MEGNGDNLRISKTERALVNAMSKLLQQRNFRKITVLNLCEEAQVGRATFYAHFDDKYAFLKHWLHTHDADCVQKSVVSYASDSAVSGEDELYRKMLTNIIADADYETFTILTAFIATLFDFPKKHSPMPDDTYANFFAFGIYGLLLHQSKRFYASENEGLDKTLAKIIEQFHKWNKEQEESAQAHPKT